MIVKGFRRLSPHKPVESSGFDGFELRLGDLMRGERATMGKSLLDVQRELKIKAAYIAAIENADPSAFDTPGFIAGYVRSYARYLHMDPDWAFDTFCRESGFATAHGMSAEASAAKRGKPVAPPLARDPIFARVEAGAVGSMLVLALLIGGLGYGGYSVLQEVQKVQFAPVEQTPLVVSDLDPLAGATAPSTGENDDIADLTGPSAEALDRLYRPQALDVPVLVARDAPISMLNPGTFGAYSGSGGVDPALAQAVEDAVVEAAELPADDLPVSGVQVSEDPLPGVQMVAVRPAWVRVQAADGTTIFESTMNKGDTFELPVTEEPATLRVGESGAIYFAINGTHYGPAGPRGQVTSNLALDAESLTESYAVADVAADTDLAQIVRVAEVEPSE
ncbi:MAG: helix-turn-helix domain-containing protein [Loktanella sp.]|nr:helix-turn-helix domain-containing protein [Loktanella sp.]